MTLRPRLSTVVLAVALVMAGNWCYTHCAFAAPVAQEASCHSSQSGAPEVCCAEFFALELSKARPEPQALPAVLPATGFQNFPHFQEHGRRFEVSAPFFSPPELFLLANPIHAPPSLA